MNRSPLCNISNAPKATTVKVVKPKNPTRTGRWEIEERLAFLQAFKIYGKGNWKEIGKFIPNRTTLQVKTHAQHVMRLVDEGQNPFKELEDFFAADSGLHKIDPVYSKRPQKKRKTSSDVKTAASALLALKKIRGGSW
ncbi:unnamed protein product [Cylindrotheca closterium]|uniref:Myb-like domain-containing protein n=1 Tax=Cylindrotheca closterium TaxID=2856 RepID=A0AAD2FNY5_9STRA|nr:unnamed protein product [Cylindrotheca closterium]